MATNFEMKTFLSTQAIIKGHITNSLDGLCTKAVSMDLMTYEEKGVIKEGNKHHQCSNFLEHFGMKIEVTPGVFYQFTKLLGALRTCDGVVKQLNDTLAINKKEQEEQARQSIARRDSGIGASQPSDQSWSLENSFLSLDEIDSDKLVVKESTRMKRALGASQPSDQSWSLENSFLSLDEIDSDKLVVKESTRMKRSRTSDSECSPPAKRMVYDGLINEGTKVFEVSPPRLSNYDQCDQEKYFCDIKYQYNKINEEFFDLVLTIFDSLETRAIALSSLRRFFTEYIFRFKGKGHDKDDVCSSLRKAEKLDDMHLLVVKYYSFCNYHMIEKLAEKYGSDEDKQNLDGYIEKFKKCVLIVHNNRVKCGDYIPGQKKISFKIDYEPDHELCGSEVDRVKDKISEILDVHCALLNLKQIRQGCLNFDFLVPESCRENLFKLSEENKEELSKQIVIIEAYYSPSEVFAIYTQSRKYPPRTTDQFLSKYHSRIPAAIRSQVTLLSDASINTSAFTSLTQVEPQYLLFDSDEDAMALPHPTSDEEDSRVSPPRPAVFRILPNGFISKRKPPTSASSDRSCHITREEFQANVLPSCKPSPFRKAGCTVKKRRQRIVYSEQKGNQLPILKIIGKKFRRIYMDFDASDSESDSDVDFDTTAEIWQDLHRQSSWM